MRTPFFLAGLSASLVTLGQPVLTFDNVGLPGSVYDLYVMTNIGSSDFDIEGEAAHWDFGTASADLAGTAIFALPQNTPYAADYPNANVALQVITDAGTTYDYFEVTSAGINKLAGGIGGVNEVVYSDASSLLLFPFAYGSVVVDDYTANGTPTTVTRTCTGWGTLESVSSITDNVIKVTSSNGEMDWYRSDPVEPLFHIGTDNVKVIWERLTFGVAEQRGLVPTWLAPNPTSTGFRIPGLESSAGFHVMDALGRLVATGRASGPQDVIDVSTWTPGVYQVLVHDAGGERAAILVKE